VHFAHIVVIATDMAEALLISIGAGDVGDVDVNICDMWY